MTEDKRQSIINDWLAAGWTQIPTTDGALSFERNAVVFTIWPRRRRSNLPIPARAPAPETTSLPLPGEEL